MRPLPPLLALCSVSAAQAQQLPPLRFEHEEVTATVRFVSADRTGPLCGLYADRQASVGPGLYVNACTVKVGNTDTPTVIILPSPQSWRGSPEAYLRLMRHEIGHWSGWPGDHSNSGSVK